MPKEIGIEVDYSKEVSKASIDDMRPILKHYTENIKIILILHFNSLILNSWSVLQKDV